MFEKLSIENLFNNTVYIVLTPVTVVFKVFSEFEICISNVAQKLAFLADKTITPTLSFTVQRIPNYKEVFTNSLMQASVDTLTGRIKSAFGSNPTAGAIIRDISKYPSTSASVIGNTTIGYTDVSYDIGTLYALRTKIICKASILSAYSLYSYIFPNREDNPSYFYQCAQSMLLAEKKPADIRATKKKAFELIARMANGLCEIPSRYLNIATREKQRLEKNNTEITKKEFLVFMQENYKLSWISEAVTESVSKTLVSDQVGEWSRKADYTDYIKKRATLIDNYVSAVSFRSALFTIEDDIWTKLFKCGGMFGNEMLSVLISSGNLLYLPMGLTKCLLVFTVTGVIDGVAKLSNEIINAYLLGIPSRAIQDMTGVVVREINEFVVESNNHFQSLVHNIIEYDLVGDSIKIVNDL